MRYGNFTLSRTGSPKCVSPRVKSPNMKSQHSPSGIDYHINRIISPYQRITSPSSIGNSTLPNFLRIINPSVNSLLKNKTKTKLRTADTSNSDYFLLKKYYKQSPISESIAGKVNNPNEVINYVFDSNSPSNQILIRVGKIELTRNDLCCLRPKKLLPINLIDACFSCIKKKNRKIFQKNDTHDRVIIVKTSFSKKVFQSKEKFLIKSKKNLLNFEHLIFPLFIGYWTLLVVSNREKKARYYDPIGIEKNEKQIFSALHEFLRNEIACHQKRDIESTRWKQLDCKRVNETEAYDDVDSAVYILRKTLKISTGKNIPVTPEVLNEYRSKLLVQLFKYGTKILY